jgi:hypothetical protein
MTRTAKAKMCFSKTRYPRKADAAYVRNYRLRLARRDNPTFLRIYHCPLCNGWHITHKR